jgi:hypothetical protein
MPSDTKPVEYKMIGTGFAYWYLVARHLDQLNSGDPNPRAGSIDLVGGLIVRPGGIILSKKVFDCNRPKR